MERSSLLPSTSRRKLASLVKLAHHILQLSINQSSSPWTLFHLTTLTETVTTTTADDRKNNHGMAGLVLVVLEGRERKMDSRWISWAT
jgi:hypothetical protein